MVSVHEWDGDMAAAVVSCETEEKFEGRGKDRKLVGNVRRIKLPIVEIELHG
jgi:hypothetical protein